MDAKVKQLLPKVKANLILSHDEDDEFIKNLIRAALDYAESYQKIKYGRKKLPSATEQAVIILSSHFYESRDGSTGGFFGENTHAAAQVWQTINRLLALNKAWEV